MSTPEDLLKKKRKWDVSGPDSTKQTPNGQPGQPNDVDVKIAAQIAAQKITSMLAQQGVPAAMACELEVFINDYKPDTRYFMCKSTTHDEVGAATKCSIKVKGRYKPPSDLSAEKPLHLLVTGDTMDNVNAAVKMLKDMIEDREKKQVSPPIATYSFEHKALVDMEGCDPQFGLLGRLLGPNGSYFQHIVYSSGAKVVLRGIGSGNLEADNQELKEPLHVMITSSTRSSLDAAKALVDNLLSTIRQEYYSFVQMKNNSAAYGYQYYQGYYDYSQYPGYQAPANTAYPAAPASSGQQSQDYSAYYSYYYQQYPGGYPAAEGTAANGTESAAAATQQQQPTAEGTAVNGTEPKKTVTEEDENAFYEELARIDSSLNKTKKKEDAEKQPEAAPAPSQEDSQPSSNSASPQMKQEPEQVTGSKRTLNASAEDTKPSHKFNPKKQMLHSFTTTTSNTTNSGSNGKYEEETDSNSKKAKTAPFWAAIDASEANPAKQHEKSAQKVSDIENEVYSELGLK